MTWRPSSASSYALALGTSKKAGARKRWPRVFRPLAMPANWTEGQDVIVPLALDDAAAEAKFGKIDKVLPYLRYAKLKG